MITREQAGTTCTFYHVRLRNADGTAIRCRANGALKTWVTRPDEWRLPVKHGLKQCFYITHQNCEEWTVEEPRWLTGAEAVKERAAFVAEQGRRT